MRRRRSRRSVGFYCAGCETSHDNIPYFAGPDKVINGDTRNLYCADTHPDKPMQNKQMLFQALHRAAGEKGYRCSFYTKSEQHRNWEAEWSSWDATLEAGKSYMFGSDKPMKEYIRKYSSPLSAMWMKLAYQLAIVDDTLKIHVSSDRLEYEFYKVGEYVEIALPHQDHGGEKHYVTKDGKRKIQINQD
jgi:hypothetical protein